VTIIVRKNDDVAHVEETGVPDEGHLQRFIFDNPDSLPLGDIKADNRLMIVGREFATSSGPIDVLAIDADGDIYIVETKLFKNPDKRRVVAQLLDYGAALWRGYRDPANFIANLEASVNGQTGAGLQQNIADFYDLDYDGTDDVIRCLADNLCDGTFKFIVLMDHLEPRLRDLVLYLNQRSQFDVYAVVMQFYRHEDIEIVIPKLFGAEVTKDPTRGTKTTQAWNETRYFETAQQSVDDDQLNAIRQLYHFSQQHADQMRWARGKHGAFRPQFRQPYKEINIRGKVAPLFTVDTDGVLSLNLGSLSRHEQLKAYGDRFVARLRELGFPSIPNDQDTDMVEIPVEDWQTHVDGLIQAVEEVFASSGS